MEIINTAAQHVQIDVGREELLILSAALNEVCNGISLFEFETRMGASRERVSILMKEIGSLLDEMDSSPV